MKSHIKIEVRAGSPAESVIKSPSGRLVIRVREQAERNQANKRALEIIRGLYPGCQARIESGHHAPRKTISLEKAGE